MTVRLMRGQCVVRDVQEVTTKAGLILLWKDPKSKQVRTHRGRVIALGPPSLIYDRFEVPWEFEVGALIQFHMNHHWDAHTRPWPPDGIDALWIPQNSIDAVIDEFVS